MIRHKLALAVKFGTHRSPDVQAGVRLPIPAEDPNHVGTAAKPPSKVAGVGFRIPGLEDLAAREDEVLLLDGVGAPRGQQANVEASLLSEV